MLYFVSVSELSCPFLSNRYFFITVHTNLIAPPRADKPQTTKAVVRTTGWLLSHYCKGNACVDAQKEARALKKKSALLLFPS